MKRLMYILGLVAALQLHAADPLSIDYSNRKALTPGPDDGKIIRIAARHLEQLHYLQQPFNDEVSSKFLDRYLDYFDRSHFYFLQSDAQEFEKYRTSLDEMTMVEGDSLPAYVIFERFLQRIRQQTEYVNELLAKEKFDFNTTNRFVFNRKDLPRPKNLEEAKKLWRDRLVHEYLTEKIDRVTRKEKADKAKAEEAKKPKSETKENEAIEHKAAPEETIEQVLKKRYARLLRYYHELDHNDVLESYLSSLTHVYDPHTDYLGKSELDNFSISMRLSLFGIGAVLRSEDGYCKIVELMVGGPAEKSKQIKANDSIIAVAQGDAGEFVDVVDMKLNKVVEMIRGPKDTVVRLMVADAHDMTRRKEVKITRDEIKLQDQEAKASLIELPDSNGKMTKIGVIDLPSFYADFDLDNKKPAGDRKSTTRDVSILINRLKSEGAQGMILDLRRNGGGSLEEAINLTGLFIKQGPVVQVKDFNGDVEQDSDRDPRVQYDGPLLVLTSRHSASASEILAGALQDYGRAAIVGDSSTHGKGTVQTMQRLSRNPTEFDPGALKVTIRKFYLPSGSSTQLEGVRPDIVLPSVNNHAEIGESALDNALPWDKVPSARFEKLDLIQPVLDDLRRLSRDRVVKDKDFDYIREDIERYKKLIADKSVSLNEQDRVREKQENEQRVQSRKTEREKREADEASKEKETKFGLKEALLKEPIEKIARANAEAAATPKLKTGDEDEERDERFDPTLKESKRILVDLIDLLRRRAALAGGS